MIPDRKFGFIGAGNMTQVLIESWLSKGIVSNKQIFVTNRTPGKLKKLTDSLGVTGLASNEELIEHCDVVILAVKPQDLVGAIEPIASSFRAEHVVLSLAAGIRLSALSKLLPTKPRVVRVMPNTPSRIQKGVVGYCLSSGHSTGVETLVESLFAPMGLVVRAEEGGTFEALTVAAASGTGFVLELMIYWQEWLEEHGFEPDVARKMTVQTFFGAAALADHTVEQALEDLQARVTSKKGVTAAGLDSMRETEIERCLRMSFEKAAMRERELGEQS